MDGSVPTDGKFISDLLESTREYEPIYQTHRHISEEDLIGVHAKTLLIDIFRTFGNYDNLQLTKMIHDLDLPYVKVCEHVVFEHDAIYKHFNFNKNNNNEIFKFISHFTSECNCISCYTKQTYNESRKI